MSIEGINRRVGPHYRATINGEGPTSQTGAGSLEDPAVDDYTVEASTEETIPIVVVADITNPVELNDLAGAFNGQTIRTVQVRVGTTDRSNRYFYDDDSAVAEVPPFTMDADGGGQWVADGPQYFGHHGNFVDRLTLIDGPSAGNTLRTFAWECPQDIAELDDPVIYVAPNSIGSTGQVLQITVSGGKAVLSPVTPASVGFPTLEVANIRNPTELNSRAGTGAGDIVFCYGLDTISNVDLGAFYVYDASGLIAAGYEARFIQAASGGGYWIAVGGVNTIQSSVTGINGQLFVDAGGSVGSLITNNRLTSNRTWTLPDVSGTVALTSDVSSPRYATRTIAADTSTVFATTDHTCFVSITSGGPYTLDAFNPSGHAGAELRAVLTATSGSIYRISDHSNNVLGTLSTAGDSITIATDGTNWFVVSRD